MGLGASKFQTLFRVVIPTASSGIITGVMLAVAQRRGRNGAAAVHDSGLEPGSLHGLQEFSLFHGPEGGVSDSADDSDFQVFGKLPSRNGSGRRGRGC